MYSGLHSIQWLKAAKGKLEQANTKTKLHSKIYRMYTLFQDSSGPFGEGCLKYNIL